MLPPGETLLVTFCLAGSLRRAFSQQLQATLQADTEAIRNSDRLPHEQAGSHRRAEKRFFAALDAELNQAGSGPVYLEKQMVAEIIAGELMMLEETGVQVMAFALLPNHVHAVLHLPANSGLAFYKSLQLLHQRTAAQCARRLRLPTGTDFWQPGFFEYRITTAGEPNIVEAGELSRIVLFVRQHAAQLKLPEQWHAWPYMYVDAHFVRPANMGGH